MCMDLVVVTSCRYFPFNWILLLNVYGFVIWSVMSELCKYPAVHTHSIICQKLKIVLSIICQNHPNIWSVTIECVCINYMSKLSKYPAVYISFLSKYIAMWSCCWMCMLPDFCAYYDPFIFIPIVHISFLFLIIVLLIYVKFL